MVSPCLCALFFPHLFLFYWEDWRCAVLYQADLGIMCLESQIKSANPVSFLSLPLTTYCMLASFFMFSAACGSSFVYVALFSAVLVMLSVQCTLILPSTASPCLKEKKCWWFVLMQETVISSLVTAQKLQALLVMSVVLSHKAVDQFMSGVVFSGLLHTELPLLWIKCPECCRQSWRSEKLWILRRQQLVC